MKRKFAPGPIFIKVHTLRMIRLLEMESNHYSLGRIFTMNLQKLWQFLIIISVMNSYGLAIDTSCEDQNDCPAHQFCYDLSKICVNYTNCALYNRVEGPTGAQVPAQCGECVEGYIAEVQATGDEASACKKNTQLKGDLPAKERIDQLWIYVASAIISIVVVVAVIYYLKKRLSDSGEKWFKTMGPWRFTPSAPPQDNGIYHLQRPFYTDDEPPIYSSVMNNNNNNHINNNDDDDDSDKANNNNKSNVKDRLVNATPFNPPSWVNIDHTYDEDDGAGNTSASTAISTTLEIEDEETNPSSWTPENITVQVPARAFHQFATEQRDNVLNAVLVRGDCRSSAAAAEESTSGPPPPPEATGGPTRTGTGGNTFRGPNVQINQMITLNMVKTDD